MRKPRSTEIATVSGAVVATAAIIGTVTVVVFGTGTSSSDGDDSARAAAAASSADPTAADSARSAVPNPARSVASSPADPTPSAAWLQVSTWPTIGPETTDPAPAATAKADLALVLNQADITDALHPRLLAMGAKCNVAAFEMAENGDLILLIFATYRDTDGSLRWKPSGWITATAPDYSMTLALGPEAAGATCTALVRNGGATFDVDTSTVASSPAG